MKSITTALFLLSAISARSQTGFIARVDLDTVPPHYDTVKVIAEVYFLHPTVSPNWSWQDSAIVITHKVKAWEVWQKEGQFMMGIKRLTYNRKEELPNVLQSWRVEW